MNERSWRDRTAWLLVLCVMFPATLYLGWKFTEERALRKESDFQATLWLAVVDQTHSGAIITNADTGEIVSWNQGAEEILGWSAEEVQGSSLYFLLPEDYRDSHVEHINDPEVRKRLLDNVLQITCWLETKRGDLVQVAITVRGVEDTPAERYRFILTFDRIEKIVPLVMPKQPANTQPPDPRDFVVPEAHQDNRGQQP